MHSFRKFVGFFLPGGFILIATFVCVRQGIFDSWLSLIDELAPYFMMGIAVLLGLRFHRSRLVFVAFTLVLADRILHYFGPGGVFSFGNEEVILHLTALLLPVNIALYYLGKERGIFNLRGLMKFLFIIGQPLVLYLLLLKKPKIFTYLNHNIIDLPLLDAFHYPQAVLFSNGGIILIFMVGTLFFQKTVSRSFFWLLLATAAGLYAVDIGYTTVYFSVAGLIIILSMIETAYTMAYHDELTGLPARRSLNDTMKSLGRRYTIAMLDIDFFKKFNDRYGHDIGDQVLCMVAAHISRVGGGGKSFRYGGEEFTVVFPGKSKNDVMLHLEGLRKSIANAQFTLRSKKRPKKTPKTKKRKKNLKIVSVTISIGVAEPTPTLTKPSEVIKAADKALYRAKKNGRNRVAV